MKTGECFKEGLLKRIEPSNEKAERSIQIAKSFIKKAVKNFEDGSYDIAIVVAYTAMFHALRAILFRDGIKERSHLCLLSYIRENYGGLQGLANDVDSYRRFRHTTLYGLDEVANKDEAENAIKVARRSASEAASVLGAKK